MEKVLRRSRSRTWSWLSSVKQLVGTTTQLVEPPFSAWEKRQLPPLEVLRLFGLIRLVNVTGLIPEKKNTMLKKGQNYVTVK